MLYINILEWAMKIFVVLEENCGISEFSKCVTHSREKSFYQKLRGEKLWCAAEVSTNQLEAHLI